MTRHRKKHRLALSLYQGRRLYFVTISVAQKRSVFTFAQIVREHTTALDNACRRHRFDVIAYCYMPDHVHILLAGNDEESDLPALVKHYKQATGYHHKRKTGDDLWQKGFYDRILRRGEDVASLARYILANPVRRGLVERPVDYPYSGSLLYGRAVFDGLDF
jgi:putative transposase